MMKLYPANIMDLMGMFPTEESCLEYLSKIRWPEGYHCLRCGGASYWKGARGLFYCRDCNHEGSVTRGTLFHDTHKPVRLWFHAIWYVVNQKNGVSAAGLQRALGLGSYHTAWEWLQIPSHLTKVICLNMIFKCQGRRIQKLSWNLLRSFIMMKSA